MLNINALWGLGAKALVGAFFVILKTDGSFAALSIVIMMELM